MDSPVVPINGPVDENAWILDREKEMAKDRLLKSLVALPKNVRKEPGQNFLLLTYILTTPERGEHGQLFPIVVCSTYEEAKRKAVEFIEKYKIDVVKIYPMAEWRPIAEKTDKNMVNYVSANDNMTIESLEGNYHKRKLDSFREEIEASQLLAEEHMQSKNPGTIEHYSYCWYRAINTYNDIQNTRKKLNELERILDEEKRSIRTDHSVNSSLDDCWLDILREKLLKRGEGMLFETIVTGYHKMKNEVL